MERDNGVEGLGAIGSIKVSECVDDEEGIVTHADADSST